MKMSLILADKNVEKILRNDASVRFNIEMPVTAYLIDQIINYTTV